MRTRWWSWRSAPRRDESEGVDLDRDGHAVRDDVVDGRACLGLLDDVAQLLLRGVALDRESDGDALVPVAHLRVQPEDPVEVDVSGYRGAHLRQPHITGGGD